MATLVGAIKVKVAPSALSECQTERPSRGKRALTLEARVPERLAAEALVILDSVDDDGPPQDVCKDKNVGLFQAGSRLQRGKEDTVRKQSHTHTPKKILIFFFRVC